MTLQDDKQALINYIRNAGGRVPAHITRLAADLGWERSRLNRATAGLVQDNLLVISKTLNLLGGDPARSTRPSNTNQYAFAVRFIVAGIVLGVTILLLGVSTTAAIGGFAKGSPADVGWWSFSFVMALEATKMLGYVTWEVASARTWRYTGLGVALLMAVVNVGGSTEFVASPRSHRVETLLQQSSKELVELASRIEVHQSELERIKTDMGMNAAQIRKQTSKGRPSGAELELRRSNLERDRLIVMAELQLAKGQKAELERRVKFAQQDAAHIGLWTRLFGIDQEWIGLGFILALDVALAFTSKLAGRALRAVVLDGDHVAVRASIALGGEK